MKKRNTKAAPSQISYLSKICARMGFDKKYEIPNNILAENGEEINPMHVAKALKKIGMFEWDDGRETAVMSLPEHYRIEGAINSWNRGEREKSKHPEFDYPQIGDLIDDYERSQRNKDLD